MEYALRGAKVKRSPSSQLDLFTDRVTSFTVDEEPEPMEVVAPSASGNGKIKFDRADLEMQLREICADNKIKVKINTHQDVPVKIDFRDKYDTVTINPRRWRGAKKVALLESRLLKTFANEH